MHFTRLHDDGRRIFPECKSVKGLWRISLLEHVRLNLLLCSDSKMVLEENFKLKPEECVEASLLLWLWWHEQNLANNGDTTRSILSFANSNVN